jgi:hypothetical protein
MPKQLDYTSQDSRAVLPSFSPALQAPDAEGDSSHRKETESREREANESEERELEPLEHELEGSPPFVDEGGSG